MEKNKIEREKKCRNNSLKMARMERTRDYAMGNPKLERDKQRWCVCERDREKGKGK